MQACVDAVAVVVGWAPLPQPQIGKSTAGALVHGVRAASALASATFGALTAAGAMAGEGGFPPPHGGNRPHNFLL